MKHRLFSLALLALLVQATAPYFLTTCPVYSGDVAATKPAQVSDAQSGDAMMADCPMMAMQQPALPAKAPDDGDHHKAHAACPLCAALSPLGAYVAAGLIALPPPAPVTATSFSIALSWTLPAPQGFAFQARAPPAIG